MPFGTLLFITVIIFKMCLLSWARPNFVFFLTDDQDSVLGGVEPLKKVKSLIAENGVEFSNMFVTTPLCCPSRASILTGKYAHHHNVVNNSISGNCNSDLWQSREEPNTFITYLKKAGYSTFHAGKYLNQYGKPSTGGVRHIPLGWDQWITLVGNSVYYNYSLSMNGKLVHHGAVYDKDYLTDVVLKHWLVRQPPSPLPKTVVNEIDEVYRKRWQTLLSVDDGVKTILQHLKKKEILAQTYIFFTSDNGFHFGQFSLPWDKRQPYEFDVRVPLFVRGPNIKPGRKLQNPVLNIDIAPTVLNLAGLPVPTSMDGESFASVLQTHTHELSKSFSFIIEHQGEASGTRIPGCPQYKVGEVHTCEVDCICEDSWNNTYTCVRELTSSENSIACLFRYENFVELYNFTKDPFQLHNIFPTKRAQDFKSYLKLCNMFELL